MEHKSSDMPQNSFESIDETPKPKRLKGIVRRVVGLIENRSEANTSFDTSNPGYADIENFVASLTSLTPEQRETLAYELHKSDDENYKVSLKFQEDLARKARR